MAWEEVPTISSSSQNTLKKVAICIPHTGFMHTEFIERTYNPIRLLPVPFCTKIPISSKAYGVTVARNSLIDEALKQECDYLLWVDTDMIVESIGKKDGGEPFLSNDPNLALKTLFDIMEAHPEVNILSGLYRAKKKEGFHYAAWLKVQDTPKLGYLPIGEFSGNFIEVDAVGFGFCLERLAPMKDQKKPLFMWNHQDEPSEDFMHCALMTKITGKRINVFTDVRLSHISDVVLKSDGTFRTREA